MKRTLLLLLLAGTMLVACKNKNLVPPGMYGDELEVADPGVKSQHGDPSPDIVIDEPVGLMDLANRKSKWLRKRSLKRGAYPSKQKI